MRRVGLDGAGRDRGKCLSLTIPGAGETLKKDCGR